MSRRLLGVCWLICADDGFALAKRDHSSACHRVDKKLIGPAYLDVTKKYAGKLAATAKLNLKVKMGGVGIWGQVPMPPNDTVSDEVIKA